MNFQLHPCRYEMMEISPPVRFSFFTLEHVALQSSSWHLGASRRSPDVHLSSLSVSCCGVVFMVLWSGNSRRGDSHPSLKNSG